MVITCYLLDTLKFGSTEIKINNMTKNIVIEHPLKCIVSQRLVNSYKNFGSKRYGDLVII